MLPIQDDEIVSLDSLEERILRAVALLTSLRKEKEAMARELEEARAAKDAALREASEAKAGVLRVQDELDSLRDERSQVRTRIEKLLGQMDLLGNQ